MTTRRRIALIGGAVVLAILAIVGWNGVEGWMIWRGIDRVDFNIGDARSRLLQFIGVRNDLGDYDTVLVIGSDERPDDEQAERSGVFADAILFWMVPTDGGDPILASLPRDLLVTDPCSGDEVKLDRTLTGCDGTVSGPERVALAVEEFTGVGVDHFVLLGFDAFIEAIDAVGGVEICVEHPLRSSYGGVWTDLLPEGCSMADGPTALRWVRSRDTQEFVDGQWRFVQGVSDSSRSERQQEIMFALLPRLKAMRSPSSLTNVAKSVGDGMALDPSLSISDAVGMVWGLRGVSSERIRRIVVPTVPAATSDGAFAVRATTPFRDLLEQRG